MAISTGPDSRGNPRTRRWARRDLLLIAVSIAAAALVSAAATGAGPVATAMVVAVATAAAMHTRLAIGRWQAASQVLASATALALLGAPVPLVGVVITAGLGGAAVVTRRLRRAAVPRVAAWAALIAGAGSASILAVTAALPLEDAIREALAAAVGGFLSVPLMGLLAPMAERAFGHATPSRMREWLSYEHPLLRGLASAAPGTFQHSVNVGVLADSAASAIGADALLARVGGLYHDVGKMNAPEFFVENQHGVNPHDQLDPADSARILRAHVTDGVDLVTSHRMGKRIADFVREHHGTGEMRLLRGKAEDLARPVDEGAFRYPGPRPRSRETGIVMIADQLEATARAVSPTDDETCDALVRGTVERIVQEQQLLDSTLTGDELAVVQRAFSRTLQAMYHHRLAYPPVGAPEAAERKDATHGLLGGAS